MKRKRKEVALTPELWLLWRWFLLPEPRFHLHHPLHCYRLPWIPWKQTNRRGVEQDILHNPVKRKTNIYNLIKKKKQIMILPKNNVEEKLHSAHKNLPCFLVVAQDLCINDSGSSVKAILCHFRPRSPYIYTKHFRYELFMTLDEDIPCLVKSWWDD